MKISASIFFMMVITGAVIAQGLKTLSGDWVRVKAEYHDGSRLPNDHYARVNQRFYFTKKEVYQIIGNHTTPFGYTRSGNTLKIEPIQFFIIEQYTAKALILLEKDVDYPARFYLIPTDSFQISGKLRYTYVVSNTDTIYNNAFGIEPIYPLGNVKFMEYLIQGLLPSIAAFQFTFVVQKDGTIGEVEVVSSTDLKKNKMLIQLVKKTSGQWIPASIKGKPIAVKLKETISLTNRMR